LFLTDKSCSFSTFSRSRWPGFRNDLLKAQKGIAVIPNTTTKGPPSTHNTSLHSVFKFNIYSVPRPFGRIVYTINQYSNEISFSAVLSQDLSLFSKNDTTKSNATGTRFSVFTHFTKIEISNWFVNLSAGSNNASLFKASFLACNISGQLNACTLESDVKHVVEQQKQNFDTKEYFENLPVYRQWLQTNNWSSLDSSRTILIRSQNSPTRTSQHDSSKKHCCSVKGWVQSHLFWHRTKPFDDSQQCIVCLIFCKNCSHDSVTEGAVLSSTQVTSSDKRNLLLHESSLWKSCSLSSSHRSRITAVFPFFNRKGPQSASYY